MSEEKKVEKKEEPVDFLKHYVEPHKKVSRDVTPEDMERVKKDAHTLFNLCFTQRGPYPGAYAMAHPQINKKDPLRFFVTIDKEVIINPVITNHTKVLIPSEEGCLSYPDHLMIDVGRWNKCTVKYNKIKADGDKIAIGEEVIENLSSKRSKVFQHEIDHFDAKYIYDKETKME